MNEYHYRKEISGGTTYHEGTFIQCQDCYIQAEGSFIPAPTFTAVGFKCDTSAEVVSTGSATVKIDKLVAEKVTLTAKSSGKIQIAELDCDELAIEVIDGATVHIFKGSTISLATGSVNNSSTGVCRAPIKRDQVTVGAASTWDTNP